MKIGSRWFYAGGDGGGTNGVLVLLMMMMVAASTVASRTPISVTLEQHISDDPDLSQVLLSFSFCNNYPFSLVDRAWNRLNLNDGCISDY